MIDIYKRKYNLGQILLTAWDLLGANLKSIFLIVLLIYIPINIILGLSEFYFVPADPNDLTQLSNYWNLSQTLEMFIGVLATLGIAWLVKMSIDGKKITFQQALSKAVSRWGAVIGTNLLLGLCVLGLILLFIVPGIIFGVFWTFVTYVVLFENKSFFQAMKHSQEVVRGRWWMTLGYLLVFGVLGVLVSVTAGIPGFFIGMIPNTYVQFSLGIFSNTLIDLCAAYFTVATVVLYVNFNATKLPAVTKEEKERKKGEKKKTKKGKK